MNVRLGVRYMSLNIEVSLITAESAENAEQTLDDFITPGPPGALANSSRARLTPRDREAAKIAKCLDLTACGFRDAHDDTMATITAQNSPLRSNPLRALRPLR